MSDDIRKAGWDRYIAEQGSITDERVKVAFKIIEESFSGIVKRGLVDNEKLPWDYLEDVRQALTERDAMMAAVRDLSWFAEKHGGDEVLKEHADTIKLCRGEL